MPGWDCHGLPIEWKIEEKYREKGKDKNEVPVNEFRRECREFAQGWINIQSDEFRRLGIEGDFDNPYTTMAYHSEARIAGELLKIAMSVPALSRLQADHVVGRRAHGTRRSRSGICRGRERHDLGEIPVFFVARDGDKMTDLLTASVVIWTTTPWTIPGNRAISYSSKIEYGLYEITEATNDFGPQPGEKLIFAKRLAEDAATKAKVALKLIRDVTGAELGAITCAHPLKDLGYTFDVPMLDGDHVTDDAGTGFVHTPRRMVAKTLKPGWRMSASSKPVASM